MRGRILKARLLLLAAGTLAGLLLAEGLTRAFAPRLLDLGSESVRFDPQLGWLQAEGPTAVRINEAHERVAIDGHALGFRAPERPYRADAPTVLVVGDSMTAGNQVRFGDAWPAGVEAHLRRRHPGLQVVNAGVDGFDLAQSYRFAERLLPRFDTVHLVLGLYVGNDIVDYAREAGARPPGERTDPLDWIRERSYFHHLLSGGLARFRTRTRARGLAGDAAALEGWRPERVAGLEGLTPAQAARVRAQFAAPDLAPVLRGDEEGERRLRSTCRSLAAFRRLAAVRGAGFTAVLLPAKPQAVPAQRAAFRELHGLGETDVLRAQAALAGCAREAGVDMVDATPALAGAREPARAFWRVDLHLSPTGHAEVAAVAAAALDGALAVSARNR